MDTNTMVKVSEKLSVDLVTVDELLRLDASIELHRIEAKELREQFIALLPEATAEQFQKVCDAAKNEKDPEPGFLVNRDFRLTTEQESELKKVREGRVAYCTQNKAPLMAEIMDDDAQKLVSFKVRVSSKGTSTTARFVKKAGGGSKTAVGLLAQLRASRMGA